MTACGSLTMMTSSSVTYNAPAAVPNPATVTLTATSVNNTTKSVTATITVTSGAAAVSVTITDTPPTGVAQVKPRVPKGHEEFLSGGAIQPELEALKPGPKSTAQTTSAPQVSTQSGASSQTLVVGPNVRVNDPQQPFPNGLLGRSETTIAASDDGGLLLAGFNDAQGFCGSSFGAACTPENPPGLSGFAFSTNGGSTWIDGGAPDPKLFNNVFTRGDPWMDQGGFDQETFFYANLAVDATTAATLGVSVHRGHFDGNSFAFEDVRTFNSPNPNDFYDKEAIAAAKGGSGTAFVSLTNFKEVCNVAGGGFGEITVWRTHDGGNTWQGPVVAGPDQTFITDPTNPACGQAGVLQQSSVPVIGPNGELYVAWQFGPTFSSTAPPSTNAAIVVARSLDGGVTFGTPVTIANINSMRQDSPVGYNRNRINDHPRIAVATSGPFRGRVYVVFYSAVEPVGPAPEVECPAGLPRKTICIGQNLVSSQIFINFSDDKGLTWSTPTRLAPDVPDEGVKRWWPVVNVESSGNVDVTFYESQETETPSNPECIVNVGGGVRRIGPANSLVDTFVVQSLDGGNTFGTPVRVTSATSNWCTTVSNIRPNFGDYIGGTTVQSRILPVWADGRNGVPDTFFAPVSPK